MSCSPKRGRSKIRSKDYDFATEIYTEGKKKSVDKINVE